MFYFPILIPHIDLEKTSAGVIVGLILNYAYPAANTPIYDVACKDVCNSSCANKTSFEVGEDIQLRSGGDENVVVAEVLSKVFRNSEGNYIEQTVSASSCGKLDSYVMWHSKNTHNL